MNESAKAGSGYPIRAVERVCDILDLLQIEPEGVSLVAVTAATELPKSSAYRYLLALEARQYAERDADTGLFRLGPAYRPQRARQLGRLLECAHPALEQLRNKVNETVNIGVLDGGEVVHVAVIESQQMMRLAARVGERGPVHATALGKVIAAGMPEENVRTILSGHGMRTFTPATIVTAEAFVRELARVAKLGYAIDDLEAQDDGRCVAVPLPGLPFLAGLSVSAPSSRLSNDGVPLVVTRLKKAATAIVKAYERSPL
ncbi:MAG: helix-turn-helix domain-containing protein [Actinobacteria bacterium]|uniref:Unannotated protein n=1 Tax=freshwater metagenome TaxID=449393 RepID=A0A6J7QWD1_9ZZZZ|nr:helix-turn-helix domain-containing protein [Actinomycetota bacterium]